jgi:hypothetical protein
MKYFKFSNKLFALLFMISSIIYVGCQKDEQKNLISEDKLSTEIRTNVQPTVENGTLKFSTEEDAYQYMRQLEQELDNENNDVLSKQTAMGFTSLLSIVKSKEGEIQPEITDNNDIQVVNDRTGSIFSAPYLNAMLNPNYEIIIGDKVYVQKNHEETWIAPKTSTQAVAVFRAKAPGSFILDTEITSDMEIDGKRLVEMMPCCKRYGRFATTRTVPFTPVGLFNECEVVGGKLWGIFVHARLRSFNILNGFPIFVHEIGVESEGKFRDIDCKLQYSDWDGSWCSKCGDKSVSIFHYKRSRDRFNFREVNGSSLVKVRVGTTITPVNMVTYPSCN